MKTKQEIIDELKKKINDIENGSMIPFMSFEQGAYSAHNKDLKLIEQLAEPQKVKAPEFVVSLMNKYRSGNPDITYYGFIRICNSKSFDGRKSPEEKLICWLTTKKENESILMKVWIDGSCCEIEQEPK